MSAEFAEDTAAVLRRRGHPRAGLLRGWRPTPLTAFATLHLKAAAAVMVTASHNPPEYNGYKVYWGNGAQIIPPHDKGIAAAIDAVEPANQVQLLARRRGAARKGLWQRLCRGGRARRTWRPSSSCACTGSGRTTLSIVYTAMHGVGGAGWSGA